MAVRAPRSRGPVHGIEVFKVFFSEMVGKWGVWVRYAALRGSKPIFLGYFTKEEMEMKGLRMPGGETSASTSRNSARANGHLNPTDEELRMARHQLRQVRQLQERSLEMAERIRQLQDSALRIQESLDELNHLNPNNDGEILEFEEPDPGLGGLNGSAPNPRLPLDALPEFATSEIPDRRAQHVSVVNSSLHELERLARAVLDQLPGSDRG